MRKILTIILSVILIVTLVACQKEDQSEAFETFINQYIIKEISEDYISMHTYFENPENYGIDSTKVEVNLGERYTEDTFNKQREELNEIKEEFEQFDKNNLNDEQKIIYTAFNEELEESIQLSQEKYDYIDNVFENSNGIHTNLPIMFTDWVLRNENDVKDLITLVDDVLPYMNSLLEYTKTQAQKGYLMIDIDSVVEYCKTFVDAKENSTLNAMLENIDQLNLDNSETYKKQLKESFQNSFIKAYENIISELTKLKTSNNNEKGLYYLTNGKEYYEDLMKEKIGSQKSVKEIKSLLQKEASESLSQIQTLYSNDNSMYDKDTSTKYNSYEDMLKDLNKFIKNDFPDVGNINYNVKSISSQIAVDGVAAYFLTPAIDSTTEKMIRVNDTNKDMSSLDTFATIAHEGLPGHMYLNAYTCKNITNLYTIIHDVLAFEEGYATYVELLSYDYVLDDDVASFYRNNQIYSYCVIALADIGIHYEGWDLDDFKEFFTNSGYSLSDSSLQSQYHQLQNNPGIFLPYYVGFIEINNLKEDAEESLGENFDLKAFHQALIQNGATYFDIVEDSINEYIKNN
jgi:uncharacterized protein (DUF885 family)